MKFNHEIKSGLKLLGSRKKSSWMQSEVKQKLFMDFVKFIIENLETHCADNILSVIAYDSGEGSLHMKELLKTNYFWHEISHFYNAAPINCAIAIGASLLGINADSVFQTSSYDIANFESFRPGKLIREPGFVVIGGHECYINYKLLKSFQVGCQIYNYKGSDELLDCNGECRTRANMYSCESENIFVYENRIVGKDFDLLGTGRKSTPNVPFGRDKLLSSPVFPFILPVSPDLGFSLRMLENQLPEGIRNPANLLAYYDNIENMAMGDMFNIDLTLVCSPDQEQWASLRKTIQRFKDSGVRNIKIYPYPIIGEYCHQGIHKLPDTAERQFYEKAIYLKNIEQPTKLFERIIKQSISEHELSDFEKEIGLHNSTAEMLPTSFNRFRPWYELDNDEGSGNGPLTTREFINASNTTLIYGASDVGKSWFAIVLAIALATEKEILGLAADDPAKVSYLDGEVGSGFASRVRQLTKTYSHVDMDRLNENFMGRNFVDSHELLEHSDLFIEMLCKDKPDVLIIDNILALAPKAWKGKSDYLFDFLRKIKEMGIAPVILHHLGKDGGKYLGSVALEALSQNIIRLDNAREHDCQTIQEDTMLDNKYTLKEAKNGKGPFIKITKNR